MSARNLIAAALLLGLIRLSGQSIDQERLPTPAQLLEQSYLVGADLVPSSRCMLLFFVANAAVDLAPDLSRKWAEELFQSTFGLPPSAWRGALQKNALAVLARADPVKAFALMPSMDTPVENDGVIPEDLRAFLARTVFPAYYQAKPSAQRLDEIRNQARIIGATGAYPYRGVLSVLKQIWSRDDAEALGWWQEILGFYAKGSKIRNADDEFISLVEGLWDNFSNSQRRHALELLISVLSKGKPPSSAPGQPVYRASVETNRGTFSLSQRTHVLLVKLVPKIQQSAPDLLKKLKDVDPIFAGMTSDLVVESIHESTVFPRSGSDPTPSPAAASAFLADQKQSEQVRALAVKDPAKALSSALQLNRFSNDAFSYLTNSLEQAEPGGASAVLHSTDQLLEKTKDKNLRLHLLVLKAESGRLSGDADLEASLTQGFDLGEGLFEEYIQSHPLTEISEVPVLQPLQALTRIGMRASPWNTLEHIRRLSDKPLEAYLLIEAARARVGTQTRNEAK